MKRVQFEDWDSLRSPTSHNIPQRMSGCDTPCAGHILKEHPTGSLVPEGPQQYQADMLPPLSCPRLVDRPRELRQIMCVLLILLLLTATTATLIWVTGWEGSHLEMPSVLSTRELRPVPELLVQMVKDPASLPVIYHGGRGKGEGAKRLTLLVLADSQAGSSELRRAVRESWVRYPCVGISASVIFTVAARDLSSDELLLLKEEAQRNRDMAIFLGSAALPESEHLLYQLGWAHTTFSYHYLLRTKDRFYVRLEDIVDELHGTFPPHSNLYWGYFEGSRGAKHSWSGKHPEPDWFLCDRFIRFAHSGGYVISQTLAQRLLRAADYLQLYANEDIAMATWLSPFRDVTWQHDVRFDTDPGQSRGCQDSFLIFPVDSPRDMLGRHQRLVDSGRVCRREHHLIRPHAFHFSVPPSQCCPEL